MPVKEKTAPPSVLGDLEYKHFEAEGREILQYASIAKVIAVDTETNARDVRDGSGFARGVSIAFVVEEQGFTHYYSFQAAKGENYDNTTLAMLKQVLEACPALVFHNAKFDIPALRTLGIYVEGHWFFDTMVAAQILNENLPSKSLDAVALHYLGEHGKLSTPELDKEKKTGFPNSTAAFYKDYAEMDTMSTWRLGNELVPQLYEETGGPDYWYHKQTLINVLLSMERRGVRVHTERARGLAAQGDARLAELRAEMGINPGSPKDLHRALIDTLGFPVVKKSKITGAPSFDKQAMEQYDQMLDETDNPFGKQLKEYRGWQKSVSSYYKPYTELLSSDGRLRCNYRLERTRTGRFSCTEPNLQQIPKVTDKAWNKDVKGCFIPDDGYSLIEVDYSQLELRLGTAYAREQKLIEVFNDHARDIFTEMAAELGWPRQDVKTFTYSVQYGAGVKRIMDAFGVDQKTAARMRDNYFRAYPAFGAVIKQASALAERDGKLRLWSGRYRHFQYASESYKAFNSLIQGGSADIMERVMVRLFQEVDSDECRMLLQVHDAITFEIKTELVEHYQERIISIMENVDEICGEKFGVRFAVDAKPFGGQA